MSAAVLCTGSEITRGEITDTNSSWLASRLTAIGFEVTAVEAVDDERGRIVSALGRLGEAHDVLVCTGGLGPTTDDLTAECAALAAGLALVRDPGSIEAMRDRFRRLGRTMVASNVKQADLPSGARILPNPIGTAPGFSVRVGRALAFFLPGVPVEMTRMFDDHVEPEIRAIAPATTFQVRLRTFGKPESTVGEMLRGIEQAHPGVTVGYRASFPEIEVKLLGRGRSSVEARERAERAAEDARRRLGAAMFGEGETTLVQAVASALRARGLWLAVAESCTGGLLAHLLTSAPASDYLAAAFVTYSNEAKTRLLGVPPELIVEHGAVSEPVARAMASGAAAATGAEVAVAITGIAGPTGGTPEKPVGLVHWAVKHPGGVAARHRVFALDRRRVQRIAAFAALDLVRTSL
jgi:nicotinamide-nucleotide amidase